MKEVIKINNRTIAMKAMKRKKIKKRKKSAPKIKIPKKHVLMFTKKLLIKKAMEDVVLKYSK